MVYPPLEYMLIVPRPSSSKHPNVVSRRQAFSCIILFRLLLLFIMAISCHVFVDHNPGDDVLRFDLRLRNDSNCYCLRGHLCDQITQEDESVGQNHDTCAIQLNFSQHHEIWKFWLTPLTKWDAARFLTLAVQPSLRDPTCWKGSMKSQEADLCSNEHSEQAHAFFPMFPIIIGKLALVLSQTFPSNLLPPTYEGTVALSGFLLNIVCLVISSWSLYELTVQILLRYSKVVDEIQRHSLAISSCLIYGIWNPANVFFITNYSESLFSACTLVGHAFFAQQRRSRYPNCFFLAALLAWMIGSYTRSNGSLNSLWLAQHGLALTIYGNRSGRKRVTWNIIVILCAATLTIFPVWYHDWQGYYRLCHMNYSHGSVTSDFCSEMNEYETTASLYKWTQQRHWNVGFFRYYELKQIPNFLLAAPILGVSIMGVYQWIKFSLVSDFGRGKVIWRLRFLSMDWPLHALSQSVSSTNSYTSLYAREHSVEEYLVHNTDLLGHYAILAVLTVVGLVLAHVQISTRLIWSSSPAIIWYMTYLLLQKNNPMLRKATLFYCILYTLLGVSLHVNFLPWT